MDLDGVGVGGKAELRAFVVQVRVLENHQNGKDTHVRGMQIFSRDERVQQGRKAGIAKEAGEDEKDGGGGDVDGDVDGVVGEFGLKEPEWMKEQEIR